MKERPIIFSGPMVRAILDGRKTQTRRVFKFRETNQPPSCPDRFDPKAVTQPCPYGAPGDRLWVRESHHISTPRHDGDTGSVEYRADYCDELARGIHWRSPVCMPRWASRIDLEIVSRRVERLDEITPDDCRAESQPAGNNDIGVRYGFGQQWEADNGPGSWAENPWVWVVEFKRVEGGGK